VLILKINQFKFYYYFFHKRVMKSLNFLKHSKKINQIFSYVDSVDKKYSDKIHSFALPPILEQLIYFFGRLFNPDFIASYLILILIYKIYYESEYFFIFKPFTHVLVCLIFTITLKRLTARPRPTEKLNIIRAYNLRQHEKNFSMPSGDSLQSANFAIIFYLYFNSFLGFYLIPCVMFARIYFFCHYLLDTIIGSILGVFISYNIYLLLN